MRVHAKFQDEAFLHQPTLDFMLSSLDRLRCEVVLRNAANAGGTAPGSAAAGVRGGVALSEDRGDLVRGRTEGDPRNLQPVLCAGDAGGLLRRADAGLIARLYCDMLSGHILDRAWLGIGERPSPVVVKRTIDGAIDLLLNGYATERLA
jgi:hypothetical protein